MTLVRREAFGEMAGVNVPHEASECWLKVDMSNGREYRVLSTAPDPGSTNV